MNDSCSSCSLDSMDRNHELNVSMSSTDSFDLLLRDVPPIETGPLQKISNLASTTTIKNSASGTRLNDSFSSLDVSASSQESLEEVCEDVSPKVSSNEGTLTNSPCDKDGPTTPVKQQDKRVRKSSWISNPMSMSKTDSGGGGGYPATLDKLFSLFQNSTAIFQRSSPDPVRKDDSAPLSRKESPMGGLLAWATGTSSTPTTTAKKEGEESGSSPQAPPPAKTNILQPNQSPENTGSSEQPAVPVESISKQLKKEVKENISPENTITATSVTSVKSQPSPPHVATAASTIPPPTVLETQNKTVIFELGDDGDDYDDESLSLSEDLDSSTILRTRVGNIDNADTVTHQVHQVLDDGKQTQLVLQQQTNIIAATAAATTITNTGNHSSSISHAVGLGNIARDSLSIIKGGVNTSQDSMRSLDSLPEFEINVPVTVHEMMDEGALSAPSEPSIVAEQNEQT